MSGGSNLWALSVLAIALLTHITTVGSRSDTLAPLLGVVTMVGKFISSFGCVGLLEDDARE